ncbi:MAG: nuclear transport factor 2 family protein [candidate division KSB1 bacterium]|nr:nuclear transport factor 2 family protein [candidate division KSB1 bacterium]MDZ7367003.1 nuclear transport factor 2 family protein [candidate division KSB1 bacterium]MDZ7406792.1 nuclear transport factor 2 family protein [candidate division KSB1 bacterium]
METKNNPVATVQRMFDAFKAGNMNALLDTIHPESRWTYVGANPQLSKAVLVGKEGVKKFFDGILKNLSIAEFNPNEFITQDDTVVVIGNESGTVKASGQPFRNEWVQKYVVKDNLITEMEEYNIQVNKP